MSEEQQPSKYDHEVVRHDPSEGFDRTEPDSKSITFFVVLSVVALVLTMVALQGYFQKVWDEMTYERVLAVPGGELADQRNLENWRLTHYEYADKSKTTVRIPFERARELFLKDAAEGKTFYPGKPTEPKPETPTEPAKGADGTPAPDGKQATDGKQAETGKQPAAGKQDAEKTAGKTPAAAKK